MENKNNSTHYDCKKGKEKSFIELAYEISDEKKHEEERYKKCFMNWIIGFSISLYFICAVLFYHYYEGWNILNCIYFVILSITTIGKVHSFFEVLPSTVYLTSLFCNLQVMAIQLLRMTGLGCSRSLCYFSAYLGSFRLSLKLSSAIS
jgi:hypothetical protein